MTVFILLASALTLIVVGWLLWPLRRPASATTADIQTEVNLNLLREQLRALEAERDAGSLSAAEFASARDDIQTRLLEEAQPAQPAVAPTPLPRARAVMWAVGVMVPLVAISVYGLLGSPQALLPTPAAPAAVGPDQIAEMITKLEARLKDKPDDAQGWAMLARSYRFLNRPADAMRAYDKVGAAISQNADWLLDKAELLATQADNQFAGQPAALVQQALQVDPQHPLGLMLDGVVAFQAAQYPKAVQRWEAVLAMMDPNSDEARQMQDNLAMARQKAGMPAAVAAPKGGDATKLPPVAAAAAAGGMSPEMINQMVDRLAQRLKDNPNDHAGWARLANAYKVLGKLDEADAAFQKTGPLLQTDVNLMTRYADFLASRAGSLQGKPMALVEQALAVDPKHPMALMMAGQGAYQARQWPKAIAYWERALAVLPPESSDAQLVQQELTDARKR